MMRIGLPLCFVVLHACGGTTKPLAKASPRAGIAAPATSEPELKVPAAFHHIPASTPYLMTGDLNIAWLAPVIDTLVAGAQEAYADVVAMRPALRGEPRQAADALIDLLGPALTARSLARIGLPTLPRYTLYGIGMMPAVRVPLASGSKLRAAVARVEALAGDDFPKQRTLGGVHYWSVPLPAGDTGPMSVVVAIVNDELVAGLVFDTLQAEMVPLLLGVSAPPTSLAKSPRLRAMVTRYSVAPQQLVFVDFAGMARLAFGPSTSLWQRISTQLYGPGTATVSPACKAETLDLLSLAPRIVGSSTSRRSSTFVWELHEDVIHMLKSSRGQLPGGDLSHYPGAVTMAVGLDAEQLGVQLVSAAKRATDAPFRCPVFAELNQAATMLANIRGDRGESLWLAHRCGPGAVIYGSKGRYTRRGHRCDGARCARPVAGYTARHATSERGCHVDARRCPRPPGVCWPRSNGEAGLRRPLRRGNRGLSRGWHRRAARSNARKRAARHEHIPGDDHTRRGECCRPGDIRHQRPERPWTSRRRDATS